MSVRALREQLRALRAAGRCLLFSSHVMQEVAALCDRIVILGEGRVIAQGTASDILSWTGAATLEDAFVTLLGTGEGLAP
jgi:sodium transport system ATP-binding protein